MVGIVEKLYRATQEEIRELADRLMGADKKFSNFLTSRSDWSAAMERGARRLLARYSTPPGSVRRDGNLIVIEAKFTAKLNARIARLPAKFKVRRSETDRRLHRWEARANPRLSSEIGRFLDETGFSATSEVRAWGGAQATADLQRNRRPEQNTEGESFSPPVMGRVLRPEQLEAVKLGARAGVVLIADEPGMGKTTEALGVLAARGAFPAIIVSPAVGTYHWVRETETCLPGKVVVIAVPGKPLPDADVIVVTWDYLGRHLPGEKKKHPSPEDFKHLPDLIARRAKGVVYDESHMAKSGSSLRCKAAKLLSRTIETRIALTGTPVENRPRELGVQLDILGILDKLFGGWWPFAKRYCGAHRTRFGLDTSGAAHLPELHSILRSSGHYIRRKKVGLPPKSRVLIPVEIDNRREYVKAENDVVRWIGERAAEDLEFRASIAHLPPVEQKALIRTHRDSAEARAARAETLVRIGALKRLAARGKIGSATEWIDNFLESGKKLVVFAHHSDVIAAISSRYNCPKITGSEVGIFRQRNIDRFQSDPSCRIIACNLRAGGVNVTLTAASDVLFLELGWTPTGMIQAEDRVHRIGQGSSVTAWYLLSRDTIEERIFKLIEDKMSVVSAVVDGDEVKAGKTVFAELVRSLAS